MSKTTRGLSEMTASFGLSNPFPGTANYLDQYVMPVLLQ